MLSIIACDLDGVFRDLTGFLNPQKWDDAHIIFKIVRWSGYKYLETAPFTKYFAFLKNLFPQPLILTHQIESWRPHTLKWIRKNIPNSTVMFMNGDEKIDFVTRNKLYLIEDSPNLKDYSRVILIDYPYNQHIRCKWRVKNVEDFIPIFEQIKEEI